MFKYSMVVTLTSFSVTVTKLASDWSGCKTGPASCGDLLQDAYHLLHGLL